MSPTAHSLLPRRFEDGRHEAFEDGLRRLGWRVVLGIDGTPRPGDVLLSWNHFFRHREAQIAAFRAAGGDAIVFEEGYIRRIGGESYFAAALGGHNGAGQWPGAGVPGGGPQRWAGWQIPVAPWRAEDDGAGPILVCAQRGFGDSERSMPKDWPDAVFHMLRRRTRRPLWFRAHPGRARRGTEARYDRICDFAQPLAEQLAGAWACVVWRSNAATQALLAGVPVYVAGPGIVTRAACRPLLAGSVSIGVSGVLPAPFTGDRTRAFEDLSWAQWSLAEFRSGEAFRHLLAGVPAASLAPKVAEGVPA